ncbi:MAG: ornithine cyclodeaminase family protein [Bdellovibrionales bacterium]|nr:ornithine cyclodeaminase family protein [Bdellovibrionales bacterium]
MALRLAETLRLTEADVARLVGPNDALEAVRSAHLDLALGTAVNVPRARARLVGATLHSMSAASSSLGLLGTKVYAVAGGAMHSFVQLFSADNGTLLAHIEANELGRLRTTAASAVAARRLVQANPQELAIIGTGFQAEGLVAAYLAASAGFQLQKIRVYSRDQARREHFAEAATSRFGTSVRAYASAAAAVDGVELVVTATSSSQPVVPFEALTTVRHISAIGSNALSRRELCPRTVTGAKLIVVDERATAEREGGTLLGPIEHGRVNWNQVEELGDVLRQDSFSLPSSGYTLYCSHGLAVQDLYLAAEVYRRAA